MKKLLTPDQTHGPCDNWYQPVKILAETGARSPGRFAHPLDGMCPLGNPDPWKSPRLINISIRLSGALGKPSVFRFWFGQNIKILRSTTRLTWLRNGARDATLFRVAFVLSMATTNV